jgi:hypothetical protein
MVAPAPEAEWRSLDTASTPRAIRDRAEKLSGAVDAWRRGDGQHGVAQAMPLRFAALRYDTDALPLSAGASQTTGRFCLIQSSTQA